MSIHKPFDPPWQDLSTLIKHPQRGPLAPFGFLENDHE